MGWNFRRECEYAFDLQTFRINRQTNLHPSVLASEGRMERSPGHHNLEQMFSGIGNSATEVEEEGHDKKSQMVDLVRRVRITTI